MLTHDTPFPQVGSYTLYSDPDQPWPPPTELVRIQDRRLRGDTPCALVSFPLRDGASGNKVVPLAELIDATPLTREEEREFHDLDRALPREVGDDGRLTAKIRPQAELSRGQRAKAKRRNALKSRMIWSRFLADKLTDMRARQLRKAA